MSFRLSTPVVGQKTRSGQATDIRPTPIRRAADTAAILAYRLAAYFMLTMFDDPALLAMAFC
jgi:hypothetical protein